MSDGREEKLPDFTHLIGIRVRVTTPPLKLPYIEWIDGHGVKRQIKIRDRNHMLRIVKHIVNSMADGLPSAEFSYWLESLKTEVVPLTYAQAMMLSSKLLSHLAWRSSV